MPPAHAVLLSARALADESSTWDLLAGRLEDHTPLETALAEAASVSQGRDTHALSMMMAATVERHLPAAALDHVARVLDEASAVATEATIAAGHATQTARMLTWLPVVVLASGFVFSDSLRGAWPSTTIAIPMTAGVLLNLLGRAAIARAVASTIGLDDDRANSPARIADCLAASLAAGLPVASACARLDLAEPLEEGICSQVARAVREGIPLSDALDPLAAHPDTVGIAETALAVAHDGVAGADAAALLAERARNCRRDRTRSAIAALPASLAVPVTVLMLPAFLLGAVVPVVAAGSGSLRPQVTVVSTQQ